MKGISLFLLAGLFFTLLTLREDKNSFLVTKKSPALLSRKIAAGETPKCMRDLFTTETLKKEVAELEEAMDTNRIQGRWRHIDLSTIPTSAAAFLLKFGDKLGDKSPGAVFDASTCSDIPCLYNLVYGSSDGVEGYVHYLWYLRTGTYLAADNLVPDQKAASAGLYNGAPVSLSDYLFQQDELYGFWRLSKMMKAPHTTLTYLKEIQRIPRGQTIENRGANTCGLAHSEGWIVLADGCLIVYPRSDSGHMFASVLHEMSHQLDYEDGARLYDDLYRSQQSDYLSMTGFELKEYRDSNGALVRQWSLRPDARIVSPYGRSSPAESFAELMAYYRIDAEATRSKVSQESYDFASRYYHGRNFESDALAAGWVRKAVAEKTRDILKALVSCETPECLESSFSILAQEEMGRIRSEEPDGCKVLLSPFIAQTLPGKLSESFRSNSDLYLMSSRTEVRKTILDNFDSIMNPASAYEAFFACQSGGADCFNEKLKEKKISELSAYGDSAELIYSAYSEVFPYEKIQQEIQSFYQSLLTSREKEMKLKADELWESCKKIPVSDTLPPTGSDFLVRDGYMVSSFYNCLNRGFASALQGSLEAVKLKEFTPKNADERAFILGLMKPRLTQIFEDHLRNGRSYEIKIRGLFTEQHGTWMYNTMRSNRYWMPRGRPDQAQIETACKNAAINLIGGDIYFHLKKELYKDLLENTCKGIN